MHINYNLKLFVFIFTVSHLSAEIAQGTERRLTVADLHHSCKTETVLLSSLSHVGHFATCSASKSHSSCLALTKGTRCLRQTKRMPRRKRTRWAAKSIYPVPSWSICTWRPWSHWNQPNSQLQLLPPGWKDLPLSSDGRKQSSSWSSRYVFCLLRCFYSTPRGQTLSW